MILQVCYKIPTRSLWYLPNHYGIYGIYDFYENFQGLLMVSVESAQFSSNSRYKVNLAVKVEIAVYYHYIHIYE